MYQDSFVRLDEGRKKLKGYFTQSGPWARAQGYSMSPLRSWRNLVQHQFLNRRSFMVHRNLSCSTLQLHKSKSMIRILFACLWTCLSVSHFFCEVGNAQPGDAESKALATIAPFFDPPQEYVNDFGSYHSPLLFADGDRVQNCLLYTSPSPRDLSTSRMPSSA